MGDMNRDVLVDRLRTAEGNANVLQEIVQGLLDVNFVLMDLLIQRGVTTEEEMDAALAVAAQDFEGGMGEFIVTGARAYLQDGDTRLVRLAQTARLLRQGRKAPPRPPKK